jgi:hypothetical protein
LYAHLVASTGWTWEYIDERLTLPRLKALNRYWAHSPPPHILLRHALGFKPAIRTSQAANSEQDLQVFMQHFRAAGGTVN